MSIYNSTLQYITGHIFGRGDDDHGLFSDKRKSAVATRTPLTRTFFSLLVDVRKKGKKNKSTPAAARAGGSLGE